jgi:hypothetical protein
MVFVFHFYIGYNINRYVFTIAFRTFHKYTPFGYY